MGMTSSISPELVFTLDDAVKEVLGTLYGMDLNYDPELDRYANVTRQLNRALRSNALEHEWSYYSSSQSAGTSVEGDNEIWLPADVRPRVVGDDAVRLVDADGHVVRWAYVLPRDALSKYYGRSGIWCAVTRNTIAFSRPFDLAEAGLDIQVPVMREPVMFRLPAQPEDPSLPTVTVDPAIRVQPIDFQYPDVITMRAAFYYAQTDPVTQPRVQTLESMYKDLMYQVIERDDRNTDSPYLNEFFVPIRNGIVEPTFLHPHPHSDERRR
jgi:hypothetical protein